MAALKQNVTAASLLLAALLCCAAPDPTDAADFQIQPYRVKISFPAYDRNETLTSFPALIRLNTGINKFQYGSFSAPASGADLRFSDSNRTLQLNHEIESWDTNGTSYVWVQVPLLTPTGCCIWASWGTPDNMGLPSCATNGAVWSNGYAGVWHLTTNFTDSTSNRNDGSAIGTPALAPSTLIAGGLELSNNSCVACADSPSLDITGSITVSAWLYYRSGAGFMTKEYQGSAGYAAEITTGSGKIRWYTWGLDGFDTYSSTTNFPKDDWHHLALVYDKENSRKNIYIDGTLDSTTNASGNITASNDPFYLGFSKLSGDASQYFTGTLDEMRVSNVARSSNWLWACFLNQSSNTAFTAFSSVQLSGGTVIVVK